ncbi:hypothetical protein GCM10028806_42350 [Spirosoma terrae]|uniref:LytTR family transcriptional regulator n=1 Tax=Spirosoma terrae TaxID=1968276 RepID=A0A6L9LB89_9BACT|nr:LytTR family DNA-binding domain-containing protein [Spirosoma terrae]NDU94099.1 LytTR family transcriptional regulator [Spirosoma terrae]
MTFFFEQASANPAELLEWPIISVYERSKGRRPVAVIDIISLEADKNYCLINLKNDQRILTTKTVKHYQLQLPSVWFIQLHRKAIVNRQFIERIENKEGAYKVGLTNGQSFPVSRRRWGQIRQQLLGNAAVKSRSINASFR